MEVNWPIVMIETKKLFKARLWRRTHWTRRKCSEMFMECYDEAAVAIADKYAVNIVFETLIERLLKASEKGK